MDAYSSNPPVYARAKGLVMVLVGASMWGLSGTVAQKLFHEYGFSPGWLVTVRLLISGALLLLMGAANGKKGQITGVWKNSKDRIHLLVFGILGMLGVQYTFFAAIDTGNAATATLLQYLAPLLIAVYVALGARKMPTMLEFVAIGLALVGTLLLVTGGKWDGLSVPGIAVFWGLLSAVALAFYTLYPASLLKKWGSEVVVGWGMLVGGCGMMLISPPWETSGQVWTGESVLLIAFVVLFGTLVAFYLYMESLRYISPTETSLLACIEPLVAVLASMVWLHVPFGIFEAIGGLCIIGTVTILTLRSKEKQSSP
jgi:drug/metabolite transporter (DMT)-like permease